MEEQAGEGHVKDMEEKGQQQQRKVERGSELDAKLRQRLKLERLIV